MTTWQNKYPLNTFNGETKKELIAFIESLLEKQSLGRLMSYVVHDDNCKVANFYPSQGRPTKDGYEQYIMGRWYQVSPVDKSPKVKCDCGLDDILKELNKQEEDCQCEACMRDMPDCCLMVK